MCGDVCGDVCVMLTLDTTTYKEYYLMDWDSSGLCGNKVMKAGGVLLKKHQACD